MPVARDLRVDCVVEIIKIIANTNLSPDAPDGEHPRLLDRADGDVDRPVLIVIHSAPLKIVCDSFALDDEHRGAVMEFITLTNHGLLEGNFELDSRR